MTDFRSGVTIGVIAAAALAAPLRAQQGGGIMIASAALVPIGDLGNIANTGIGFDLIGRTPPIWGSFGLRTDITIDSWNGSGGGAGSLKSVSSSAKAISLIDYVTDKLYWYAGTGIYGGQEKFRTLSGATVNGRPYQTMGAQGGVGLSFGTVWGQPFAEVGVAKVFGPTPTAFAWFPIRVGFTIPPLFAGMLGSHTR